MSPKRRPHPGYRKSDDASDTPPLRELVEASGGGILHFDRSKICGGPSYSGFQVPYTADDVMTVHLTIDIPDELYQRLEDRAAYTRRSIEEETLDVLAGAVPTVADLAEDLARELRSLENLADAELRQLARSRLPVEAITELQTLHLKQQREGLSDVERQRCQDLVLQDERNLLRRAKAAAVLKSRGVNVDEIARS